MLRQIEELRKRDARKKALAENPGRAKSAAPKKKAASTGAAAAKPAPSAKRGRARAGSPPSAGGRTSTAAPVQSQPYYGVEMKSIGGQWVQMHPDSE
ncbi:hypothetical protein [Streptomyces cinereoruber]|uniref:hypothetical protein n=1 Tax=Streptomyces cinereoruber TaxID=67260 RepID=UPI00345D5F55